MLACIVSLMYLKDFLNYASTLTFKNTYVHILTCSTMIAFIRQGIVLSLYSYNFVSIINNNKDIFIMHPYP